MIRRFSWARAKSRALAGALVLAGTTSLTTACLRRDVVSMEPTTKTSFTTQVPQPAVDKVDLIVMVDNSASMADKQRILADALPDLLNGLVRPKCVDKKTRARTDVDADPLKPEGQQCPAGTEPAFPPITDMHIGVLSSSLGGMGTENCKPGAKGHPDDHGHLLARGANGPDVAQAGDLHFLAWYPDVPENQDKTRHPDPPVPKTTSLDALGTAFRDLIVGVGQDGCGLEAQLESVYHFLVQPDPWTTVTVDPTTLRASYGTDIDQELLRQRAAFLRPDSLVAVIVLSDEDDSTVDPLSFGASGWYFEQDRPMSRGTSACATDAASPACRSCHCEPADSATCVQVQKDPECAKGEYSEKEDPLNVRFARMKQRFGVDPQYPIARYVDAFTKSRVPRRDAEHVNGSYAVGRGECTNPLFAARLPVPGEDFCKLPLGPRTKDLVYFAVIGGVPNGLLGGDKLDWTPILGRDPFQWDETGIDPHMIPSTTPRPGLPGPGSADDADPVNGREWTTAGGDLQFACTFPLYERTADGGVQPVERACDGKESCDCDGTKDVPLCSPTNRKVQVRGKAYPTRRELMVARELKDQAVVASLCPEQLTEPNKENYGYRPAARSIVNRLERSLLGSCLPRPLVNDGDGTPCLTLAVLPNEGPDTDCQRLYELGNPPADLLDRLRKNLVAEEGEAAGRLPICLIPEVIPPEGETCRDEATKMGFCYSHDQDGFGCADALVFTKPTRRLGGARFLLQCIQVGDSR
ncbi:hypothetical protein AKJ09_10150 [Labilithrix luteola]|uniref:Uncharacterized protein n=1 Tax=Labilithrix luteola TaxID=1391654 RepID=A0A0K1QCU6_9BACT|nr:hypothetical protein [Labilithrix luteola]AKV03487.1 hypothetical protein AKJ09_10150 [Labilithrix luteola]